jgi:hypothetical protein
MRQSAYASRKEYAVKSNHRPALFAVVLALFAAGAYATPASPYGSAGAAATASSWSLEQMLRYAIEDEHFARAEYVAVMRKFGEARPFSNIKQSEDQHVVWLAELYAARKLAVPADDAASRVPIPATLLDAYKTGERAEIDNIAMYEAFLSSPVLAKPENADVRAVFERLKAASENHLKAFRNQLARF